MKKLWKPALLLAAIAVMVIGLLGSGAWFTDAATSATTEISSGTLSIDDAKLSTLTIGTIANMAPGDITGPVEIIIENNGNMDLAWFGDLQVGSSILRNVIYIESAKMEFLTPGGNSWYLDKGFTFDQFITDGHGSGPYPDWYNGLVDPTYEVITLAKFDGTNAMGSTPNEFMGALKPGYKYKLTLTFGMAPKAGNEFQTSGPLTINLRVDATQIKLGALEALRAGYGTHLSWLQAQIADQVEP